MDDTKNVNDWAIRLIKRHEGYSKFPKPDAKNSVEVGYGTNLTFRGISLGEAGGLLENDVNRLLDWFSSFPFFARMTDRRKVALIDMAYDVGEAGIDAFTRMLAWLDAGLYDRAADEMLNSAWANEVPTRAQDDAAMMRRG